MSDLNERPGIVREADEMDMASNMEIMFTESAIHAVQCLTAPQKHPDFDGENCLDCAEPIPTERLSMFKIRCVCCQTAVEEADKRRGHNIFF